VSVALKAQPGVESIDVIPVRQVVTVTLKPGSGMTVEKLRGVIRAAGFPTPKDPIVTTRGTVDGGVLVDGSRRLALEGAIEPLRAAPPGSIVTVSGTLLLAKRRSDSPPTLVVTSAKIAAESQSPR
jgi:hypothetical protein